MDISSVTENNSAPSSILDITSLNLNDISNKMGILRNCSIHNGQNGVYAVFGIQDICGRVITGYYFNEDAELIYKNWPKYSNYVCMFNYEVKLVYNKTSLTINNLKVVPKDQSDVLIKSVFKLTDKNHLSAQEYILSVINSRENSTKDMLVALINSSYGSEFINGMNSDFLEGKIGGNSIFTEYIFRQIVNIPSSLNITEAEKDDMLLVYLMCESAIYAEKSKNVDTLLLFNIVKIVSKFNAKFKSSVGREINPITINGYLGNRFNYTADSTLESTIIYQVYNSAFTIFNIDSELRRIPTGMTTINGTNIFR